MIKNPRESIEKYAKKHGLEILDRFGVGAQGCVYGHGSGNAMKAFERREAYENELKAYRLRPEKS